MKIPEFPSPEEIKKVVETIETRLQEKPINMRKNFHVKEGFTKCVEILNDRLKNPENPFFLPETNPEVEKQDVIYRDQLKGIDKLKTQEGRAIVIMCVDFLNGQMEAESFTKVSIKKR